jgi:hypothetical protein
MSLRIEGELNQIAFTILNGSRSISLISLNTASNVKPKMRNGSSMSQTIGNRKNIAMANGQQITNKIHHKTIAINVLIRRTFETSLQISGQANYRP